MTATLAVSDAEMIAAYHQSRKLWRGLDSFTKRNSYRKVKALMVAGLKERKGVFTFEAGTMYLDIDGHGILSDTDDRRPTVQSELTHWNKRIERTVERNRERYPE